MYNFKFNVNKELEITSLDENIGDISSGISGDYHGNQIVSAYSWVVKQNGDAVRQVFRDGKPIQLVDYQMNCLCGMAKANIFIDPLRDETSEIVGAEVTMKVNPVCLLSKKLNESRMLIDIGKASAGLAHGVRSPLNAIKGAILYLKGTYCQDPTFQEFSTIIECEINKLDKFITKFLSSSLNQPEISDININEMIDRILKMLSIQAYLKKITFNTDPGEIPDVRADYMQIEHAVQNIITNSIESINNEGFINIKTRSASHENRTFVIIEISDSGHGFDDVGTVNTLREESVRKGRGFGLFITHEIVKNLGGNLEITSEKMVGTKVKINIPVEQC